MVVTIAGEKKEIKEGTTVAQLIIDENVENADYVTVTINDEFVDSENFDSTVINENDVVEFLYFMGEWKFDPKYWPDPKAMCDELKEMGIEPVVSVWPTTNPKSENYFEMSEANMLIRTENGQYGTFDFYGQQTFIDPTTPATGPYVWKILKKN